MPRVAVIGGGLSALTVAYRLKQRGVEVRLLDRAESVGGVIRSERRDGYLLEWGPNSFRNSDELADLIHELHLDERVVTAEPSAARYIFHRGELKPVPAGIGSFLSTSLLSAGAKLRILKEPFVPRRNDGNEESISQFITRRLGSEIDEVFVGPFISGVYAGDSQQLSVQAALPKFAEMETLGGSIFRGALKMMKKAKAEREKTGRPRRKISLISFRDGVAELPFVLGNILSDAVVSRCREITISRHASGSAGSFSVSYARDGEIYSELFDAAVVGVPAFAGSELIRSLSARASEALAAIPYPPVVVVCVACGSGQLARPLDGFGFLIPRAEGLRMLGCIWSSSLFPERAPLGQHLLTIFLGGSTDPEIIELNDDQIASVVREDLKKTLGASGELRVLQIARHARAIPQYTFGHLDRVQAIERASSDVPGLFFTGNYLRGVSGGDCVVQSNRAAGQVMERLSSAPRQ